MEKWKYDPARDLDVPARESIKSVHREVGLITTATNSFRWLLMRGYFRVFHRREVQGKEHLPDELPAIFVANHTSHLDALVLASVLSARLNRRVFPVAAGDTFFETTPMAAFASLFMNALPLWRHKCCAHSLEDLRTRLIEEPCGYIVFPEGTRSREGRMARFKPGIGKLVAGTTVPVLPCHVEGAHRAWPAHGKWPRPFKIRLRIGEARCFDQVKNDRQGWNQIAASLEEAVIRLSEVKRNHG